MRAIDIRDLLDQPGASKNVHVDEPLEGMHMELADVPEEMPVSGDLLLENVVEGVLVSGSLAGRMALRCARCLKEFDRDFALDVSELFVRVPGPEDEEYGFDAEGLLDPEPMVRDAVALSIPFSPLCKPDCLGLCERCGGDRNLGECTCAEPPTDPRWSGLEQLLQ